MKSYSFFTTLFLGNIFLIGFILGFGFWRITSDMNRYASDLSLRFQYNCLSVVKDDLERSWHDADKLVANYCNTYSKAAGLRLTVVLLDGRVLGDSDYPADKMQLHNTESHPEIISAMSGKYAESIRLSRTNQIRYRYIASPIYFSGEVVGVVRVALPVSDLVADRRNIFYGVLTGFVFMLFAAVILSIFLTWVWYKPLRVISESAGRIAAGKFEPIGQISASRELVHLINSINQMQKTVVGQLETISRQREQLQAILRNLPDAVFAMNAENNVVYYNESAKRLFELGELIEPVPIQFLLRYSAVLNFYFQDDEGNFDTQAVLKFPKQNTQLQQHEAIVQGRSLPPIPATVEITRSELLNMKIGERKYSLDAEKIGVPIESDCEGIAVLLLFNDVTAIAEANRMKADFVANTSHELRTPLATIRAALDNVTDGICDDVTEFRDIVAILDRHITRLETLTYDLLSLHDAECETVTGQTETTTVNDQKDQLEALFSAKVADKNIQLIIDSEFMGKPFLTDIKRLELVLQNLVDNAIKFTPTGGLVRLTFTFEGLGAVTIRCSDNGCGISEDEQSRVFERFYRAKTRDGVRVSGTGLGLAIVKHAVERLNGTITLESHPNQGSIFTVKIPIESIIQKI
ncbi:MAG: PAS domain-containing protein [Planctomycetaceae bacterium]|jgi:two-component system phosphate regulon sensor histidine kinase PhoR|nr:PAS domain-containing protein [Planctomycetaceae bacterium]